MARDAGHAPPIDPPWHAGRCAAPGVDDYKGSLWQRVVSIGARIRCVSLSGWVSHACCSLLRNAGKPTCLYLSSRARQHFVFVETDATLFADPFPFLEARDTVASVTCAAEVRPPNRGYTGINVGVLSLKSDPRVRTALRQLVELMAARPELDGQSELTRELAFFNTEEREFVDCVASADGFTTACCGYWPNATYVIHAGGLGGTQGKWHFFEDAGFLLSCPNWNSTNSQTRDHPHDEPKVENSAPTSFNMQPSVPGTEEFEAFARQTLVPELDSWRDQKGFKPLNRNDLKEMLADRHRMRVLHSTIVWWRTSRAWSWKGILLAAAGISPLKVTDDGGSWV